MRIKPPLLFRTICVLNSPGLLQGLLAVVSQLEKPFPFHSRTLCFKKKCWCQGLGGSCWRQHMNLTDNTICMRVCISLCDWLTDCVSVQYLFAYSSVCNALFPPHGRMWRCWPGGRTEVRYHLPLSTSLLCFLREAGVRECVGLGGARLRGGGYPWL